MAEEVDLDTNIKVGLFTSTNHFTTPAKKHVQIRLNNLDINLCVGYSCRKRRCRENLHDKTVLHWSIHGRVQEDNWRRLSAEESVRPESKRNHNDGSLGYSGARGV